MKKREIDIFGMLLGLVIGCILGFFLSSRINLNEKPEDKPAITEKGYVHLLQVAKVEEPSEAFKILEDLNKKGLKAVAVKKGNNSHYIYGGIALEEENLASLAARYLDHGIHTIVVKEYLLDKLNSVIENDEECEFWSECINNLLNSLEDKEVEVSPKYALNRKYPEVLVVISFLKEDYDSESTLLLLQLDAYRLIVETLA
ncbi:MAG TPA: hypothetical protein GX692_02995 [Acholeplasmataceae bacterium]|jgi:uncharacterized protein YneF (UPF0154 family)|nr:hypothetical protein [Acholeplasmataceae bacterium]